MCYFTLYSAQKGQASVIIAEKREIFLYFLLQKL